MDKFIEQGKLLGLDGAELRAFVEKERNNEREERRLAREAETELARLRLDESKLKLEAELQRENAERQHKLEMRRLEIEAAQVLREAGEGVNTALGDGRGERVVGGARGPKIPPFNDNQGGDDMDAYLHRFERHSELNGWVGARKALNLSTLLTGRALEVYTRLSVEQASDYDSLKDALLSRYQLTSEGLKIIDR